MAGPTKRVFRERRVLAYGPLGGVRRQTVGVKIGIPPSIVASALPTAPSNDMPKSMPCFLVKACRRATVARTLWSRRTAVGAGAWTAVVPRAATLLTFGPRLGDVGRIKPRRRRRCAGGADLDADRRPRTAVTDHLLAAKTASTCKDNGAPSRTRTDTVRILSPLPLPIGLWGLCRPEPISRAAPPRLPAPNTAVLPQCCRWPSPAHRPGRSSRR